MSARELLSTTVLLLLALGLAAPAVAQETAPTDPAAESPPPAVVPVGQISSRSAALSTRLEEIRAKRPTRQLEAIEAELPQLQAQAATATERVEVVLKTPGPGELEGLASIWRKLDGEYQSLQGRIGNEAHALDQALSEIGDQSGLWQRTLEQARSSEAPDAVLEQIEDALAELESAKQQVGDDLARVLELLEPVDRARSALRPILERIETATQELTTGLLVRQDEPVWRSIPDSEALVALPGAFAQNLSSAWAELVGYVRDRPEPIVVEGLVFLFLAWFLSRTQARRQRLHPDRDRAGSASDPLRHPWAAAFLVAVLMTTFLQPERVQGFRLVVVSVALVAWFRVLTGMLAPALRGPVAGLAVLAIFELLRNFLSGVPVLDRSLLVLNLAGGLAGIVWLRRPERLQHVPWRDAQSPWLRLLEAWMRLLGPALGAALLAALLGYTSLADRIAIVSIWGLVGGSVWAALVRVAETVIEDSVEEGALARLRMIRNARTTFLHAARRGLRGLGAFGWLYATLALAGLWSPARDAAGAVLSASFGYGEMSVSLGGVFSFFLTLWISWLLARLTSFALDQEVFTRVRMKPGVPFALSTFTRYAILVMGFMVAMGAIGFSLDRVTLLLSAVGVGIGFGLQTAVNNFVSGVILLFERPIRVGDRVQLDELYGIVSHIGMRASKVRTFDGSDVIVPNGDLVASRVVNWTLADRRRRMILPVGVAYGTRPRRVIEVLDEVVRAAPRILDRPEPLVVFRGFGDSSLDFEIRAFTEEDWIEVSSDLAVAVSEALEAAGITIPFPQRDLHLRNLPELRDALREVVGPPGAGDEE